MITAAISKLRLWLLAGVAVSIAGPAATTAAETPSPTRHIHWVIRHGGSPFYIYQNASGAGEHGMNALWATDFSYGSGPPIVYNDTTHLQPGHSYDLYVPGYTAWQPASEFTSGHPSFSGIGPFGFDLSPYTWMTFDIWTDYPTQNYDMLYAYLGNMNLGQADQAASAYLYNLLSVPGVSLTRGAWNHVRIPLAYFGQLGIKAAYKFSIRDNSNNIREGTTGTAEAFYLDNFGFAPGSYSWIYDGGAPNNWNAAANQWNSDPSTPLNGWADASVGATANYGVDGALPQLQNHNALNGLKTPGYGAVMASTNVIQLSVTAKGGMWKVSHNQGFKLSPYTYLTFGLLPTQANYGYAVQFYDTNGNPVGAAVSIGTNSPYTYQDWGANGQYWTIYCIPLANFGGLPAAVGGLSLQDTSGATSNTLYISAPGFFN
jgi:hypothetical protein